jgi:hypothetical protein
LDDRHSQYVSGVPFVGAIRRTSRSGRSPSRIFP